MEEFHKWEELDIDDSDIFRAHECRLSRPTPPPHPHSQPLPPQPHANILPSKRSSSTTDAILNRFKKHNVNNTQTLTNPTPSIPPDLPPLEPCSSGSQPPPQPLLDPCSSGSQPPPLPRNGPVHSHRTVGFEDPKGLDDLNSNSQPTVCRTGNEDEEARPSVSRAEERSQRIFPGPAGAVQRALHKKVQGDAKGFVNEGGAQNAGCSTIQHDDNDDDVGFKEGPWLCALDYLSNETPGCSKAKLFLKSTISFIKLRGNIDRIPQVLGIIKTCVPNKLGGMFVNLKDPTGTIGGFILPKVVSDSEYGRDISVGAVLLLHQVVVFSPTPWAHYLNITLNNVVKVFKKSSCLPERRNDSSSSKNWRSLNGDMFPGAGTSRISNNRDPQHDATFSPKENEPTNNMLNTRLFDKTITSQNASFYHQNVTIDNKLEKGKAPAEEGDSEHPVTCKNIASSRFSYENVLEVTPTKQNPKAGTSSASENVEVCCNRKASMPVRIDWNDEVEMLLADQLDLFP